MRKWNVLPALFAAALLAWPVAVSAQLNEDDEEWVDDCEDWGDDDSERFCEVRVTRLAARSSISAEPGRNGGAQFIGWDRNEIEVHARIQASARSDARARELAQEITIDTDGTLSADGPEPERRENWNVTFVVYVPRRIDVEATAYNGPVSAREITGRIRLETHNGPLSLTRVSGDVQAQTRNGPLHVELSGDRWDGAGLDAETRNGPVTLEVPEGYNAELETGTINGPMNSSVPLSVQFMGGRRHLNATLGSGGQKLRVVTSNGPFTLRRP